jgi:hypothetical protein
MRPAHLLATLLCAALVCPAARAGWEGRLRITEAFEGPGEPREGRIAGRGGKVRIELQVPPSGPGVPGGGAAAMDPKGRGRRPGSFGGPGGGPMTSVLDLKARKGFVLFEQRKGFFSFDLDEAAHRRGPGGPVSLPACQTDDAAACLSKAGFKKSGSEQVNGLKATRWERNQGAGEAKVHDAVWVPDGFKEFVFVRSLHQAGERTRIADVLDLKKADPPAERFAVPAGYQDLGAMMRRFQRGPGGPPPGGPADEE